MYYLVPAPIFVQKKPCCYLVSVRYHAAGEGNRAPAADGLSHVLSRCDHEREECEHRDRMMAPQPTRKAGRASAPRVPGAMKEEEQTIHVRDDVDEAEQ